MKRKTFIKQLMGRYCVSRNAANGMAKAVPLHGGSYVTGLQRYDQNVKEWAATFGLPYSMLLTREKGASKAYRRHLKNQKRAAHLIVYTHENRPAPGAKVTVRVGRSKDQQETGAAAKPAPKITINVGAPENWPPNPQPAAGYLYAIDTTPQEETSELWQKENPHTAGIKDAIANAVNAMYERQRGVLGR